jgi:hypothetical protein
MIADIGNNLLIPFLMVMMVMIGFFGYRWATRADRAAAREARRLAAELRKITPPTHCRQCGYDLRGGHERCPECGTVVKALDGERLLNEWPSVWIEPRRPLQNEVAVIVHVAYNSAEARELVHQLRARGVWAWIGNDSELSGSEPFDELAVVSSTLDRELAAGIIDHFRVSRRPS